MGEGLSATDVGRELMAASTTQRHVERDRVLAIAEAGVLAIVTLVAAWSGYAAAKWTTESRFEAAGSSATRAQANRKFQQSLTLRSIDASMFNAWFAARLAGDRNGARVAAKRFRPEYWVAFEAWLATKPFTNPNAPPGPQNMPQYRPAGEIEAQQLDGQADEQIAASEHAGETGDDYIRTTVILASVLFLVGISGHFPIRSLRIALVVLGALLLVGAAIAILRLPAPP